MWRQPRRDARTSSSSRWLWWLASSRPCGGVSLLPWCLDLAFASVARSGGLLTRVRWWFHDGLHWDWWFGCYCLQICKLGGSRKTCGAAVVSRYRVVSSGVGFNNIPKKRKKSDRAKSKTKQKRKNEPYKGARFTPEMEDQQERPIWWPTSAVEGKNQWWRDLRIFEPVAAFFFCEWRRRRNSAAIWGFLT